MRRIICIMLSAILLFSLVSCLDDSTLYKETGGGSNGNNTGNSSGNSKLIFSLNETAVFKNLKITATEIVESEGEDYFVPEDGKIFVGVKFTIENISSEIQNISTLLLFDAYVDDVKCAYSISAACVFDEGTLDGSLEPGKKMIGWYAVEVPANWKTIDLAVKAVWLSNNTANFVFEK